MASPFKQNKASFLRSAPLPTPSLSFPPLPEAPAAVAELCPTPGLAVQNLPRPECWPHEVLAGVLEHRPRCTFPILWPHVVPVRTTQLCFAGGSCRHKGRACVSIYIEWKMFCSCSASQTVFLWMFFN